ncbi:MAG: 6-pyruvoyl trahydropterin synthase family protein [Candidatus Aminicenantia bacterium]
MYEFNPSAENLSKHFYYELKKFYPVKKVVVWESENAGAEYSENF